MNKSELREKIKYLIKQSVNTKSQEEVNLDDSMQDNGISFDSDAFPILGKFPELREVLVTLLTDQYELFIKDIMWVAPKPTMFRIVCNNDQSFFLTFTPRTWIAQIEGKKYYLLNLNEEQSALNALSRILKYGNGAEPAKKELDIPEEEPKEEPTKDEKPEEEA